MNTLLNSTGKVAFSIILFCFVIVGCESDLLDSLRNKIDEYENRLDNMEDRVVELERICGQQNTNIESLTTIVSALQNRDCVTGITPIKEDGKEIGYTITFVYNAPVTIYNGKDGQDGNDGVVPQLGVKLDTDGIWYWTIDGVWLTDNNGDKVRASGNDGQDGKDGDDGKNGKEGVTPRLKIVDGYWFISYDDGATWSSEPLGPSTGEKGDSIIKDVNYDEQYVYITLPDGTVLSVPRIAGGNSGDTETLSYRLEKVTATTATFSGNLKIKSSDYPFSQVTVYYTSDEIFHINTAKAVTITSFDNDGAFSIVLKELELGTKYKYCIVTDVKSNKTYTDVIEFTTDEVTCELSVSSVTATTASFIGKVTGMSDEDRSSLVFYIHYSTIQEIDSQGRSLYISDIASDGSFSAQISNLNYGTKYYYCSVITSVNSKEYSSPQEFTTINPYEKDLNVSLASGFASSANCYIVSKSGLYKFRTVKGNSTESVGTVTSTDVLWESFGTDVAPVFTDLISGVCYKNGYIAFEISSPFREGNAVIAAKDADGNILWSWHIWLTDAPQGQTYNNNAGVMMDRNLGATSATPGDVGALGLLYQWGRKDPFLNSSSISSYTEARSTIIWPLAVSSSSSTGIIAYATSHPTTFITNNGKNSDWYYTGSSSTDDTRWQSSKTIYDPCPAGWRVPDGGSSGVWSKAFGTSRDWEVFSNWDDTNKGIDFSKTNIKLGSSGPIWYPASGGRYYASGTLVGGYGYYCSVSPNGKYAYALLFYYDVYPAYDEFYRAYGQAVRCLQE